MLRTGIHIKPRIDVEHLPILLWEGAFCWARWVARRAAACALRLLGANAPKTQFAHSHKGVAQQWCSPHVKASNVLVPRHIIDERMDRQFTFSRHNRQSSVRLPWRDDDDA